MNYPPTSPYYLTSTYNNEFLDVMINRPIPFGVEDLYWEITQTYHMRPDLLAYDIYGDPELWWVFMVRNKSVIKDAVYDFVPGQTIFLPKLATIKSVIGP